MIERVGISTGRRSITGDWFTCNGQRERIVILLHGFLSSKEDMRFITESLAKSGIDSLAIDLNGHGESGGDLYNFTVSRAVEDCLSAISFVLDNGYKSVGIFGFSIGGFIALNAVREGARNIKALALGAPVSSFSGVFDKVDLNDWKKTNVLNSTGLGLSIRLNYAFYEDGLTNDGYARFSRIGVPVLIIHGTNDDVVPISQSEALLKSLKNANLVRVTGAGHSVFSNGAGGEALDSLVEWLSGQLLSGCQRTCTKKET